MCQQCNSSFIKIENTFAEEPLFNAVASVLGVVNGRTGSRFTHDRFGIGQALESKGQPRPREFGCDIEERQNGQSLELHPQLRIDGVATPLRMATTQLTNRWLALYSRCVHKIAFEWYAYAYYVTGAAPDGAPPPMHPVFAQLRAFVREGKPMSTARPTLRWTIGIHDNVYFGVGVEADVLVAHMNLLGITYVAALAGTAAEAEKALRLVADTTPCRVLLFAQQLDVIDHGPHQITGNFSRSVETDG